MPGGTSAVRELAEEAAGSLLDYCRNQKWVGYDPYDALNSRIISQSPLFRFRLVRLAATQLLKRLPLNLRPLLQVPKGENPKGCALFCQSLLRLPGPLFPMADELARERLQRLLSLRSAGYARYCWGYDFDWQSSGFFLPKFTPNIICTSFAGNALLDAYLRYGEEKWLEAAASAAVFLDEGLNKTCLDDSFCFSYTPIDHGQVHNANLLGAAFLGRLGALTGAGQWHELARRAVRFSIRRQGPDGSWPYGEAETQRWIDNFHTGYNLCALGRLSEIMNDEPVSQALRRGLEFYIGNFFTEAGTPKYYHDRLWPIDIHSAAQSIITLCELAPLHDGALELAARVCRWTVDNLRSPKGYFYYQRSRWYSNTIPYLRWSQAWMLYALAVFLASS